MIPPHPALAAALLAGFAAAIVAPVAYRRAPRLVAWGTVATAGAMFAVFAGLAPAVVAGAPLEISLPWAPALGVRLRLFLDGLSLLFALLITGIGGLVLAYAIGYLGHGRRLGRFLGLMMLFLGSMLGLVLADDPVALYVFWELTSISSFFLIAFDDSSPAVRARARLALLITSAGGLVLLIGLVLVAGASAELGGAGTLSGLADLDLNGHRHYVAIVVLVAIGAFTKSAQVPFHVWLPGAMVAPTPVSAYLHAATMVKAGIYLLARLLPALGGTELWTTLLVAVGGSTLVAGAALGVLQRDLKLTLAYSTIAVLGALTMLLGIGTRAAIEAFVILLLAHALYKAALFLVAGNVDHHAGSRNPWKVRGLARAMPVTAAAAALAAASMAGVFPFFGFAAKELVYLASLTGPAAAVVAAATVAGGTLLVAAAWIVGVAPFFRGLARSPVGPEPSAATSVPPILLAALGAALALAPGWLVEPLASTAVSAIASVPAEVELALWHGVDGVHGVVLGLGILSLAAGTALFAAIARRPERLRALARRVDRAALLRVYDGAAAVVVDAFAIIAARLQSGVLRHYLATTVAVVLLVAGVPMVLAAAAAPPPAGFDAHGYEIILVAIVAASALAAAITRRRLAAIALLGVTGLSIAFLFAVFSAPDLAITQVMVETLMLIVLVAVFRTLPPSASTQRVPRRLVNAGLAAGAGVLVACSLLVAGSVTGFQPDASAYFVDEAARHGASNVVNAILVDFRALDTLGEICVVAVAGLGVYALLRRRSWTR